ncbi:MAG: mechanosensitive ion channel [Promethearchaeota archaeon]|nr:MAG: mechanosensitive ion channel [Candidatus Lokiarchaeota archaeon]
MRKSIKILLEFVIFIVIMAIGYWVYYYSGLDQLLINLILLNIFVYILRTIIIGLSNTIVRNRIFKYVFSLVVNIIWLVFIFSLLFFVSPTLTIAIISFLLVAISLSFSDIINNIASGLILISKEDVEIGDLVETNSIQGIINEINLNYTVIRELDGVFTYIPNTKVFNASVKKFTFRKLDRSEIFNHERDLKKYLKDFQQLVKRGKKITNYTKVLEILPSVDPEKLDSLLAPVFDKYEPLLGMRPDYLVDSTTVDRLKIVLLVMANSPNLVLEYIDLFLRDILFQLYPEEIFEGWESGENKGFKSKFNEGGA